MQSGSKAGDFSWRVLVHRTDQFMIYGLVFLWAFLHEIFEEHFESQLVALLVDMFCLEAIYVLLL